MNTLETILGILAFAVVIAVLYVWGLKKSYTQSADLERILLSKSAGKVVNYLKKNEEITLSQMAQLCTGVKAGQFWSRQRAMVQHPKTFAPKFAQYMVEQLLLEKVSNSRYRLRK